MAVFIGSLLFAWVIDIPPILSTSGSNTVLKSPPIMNSSSSFYAKYLFKDSKKALSSSRNIYICNVRIKHFYAQCLKLSQ